MRTILLSITVLLVAESAVPAQASANAAKPVRVCAVCQSWQSRHRNLAHVLGMLEEAAAERAEIVCLPEDCLPTDGGPEAQAALDAIAKVAAKRSMIVAANLKEKAGDKLYSTSYLIGADGKRIGKYRISQYGGSTELPVFKTDFGVVGLILCGDVYSPEISRAVALQGAEIILCGSQSWGASGQYNQWMQQARAIDNGVFMAVTHYPTSEISQRSYVIDPYGYPVAATQYWGETVCSADIDLDAGRVWFAPSDKAGAHGRGGYLSGYFPKTVPEKRTDFREVLFAGRRPELYRPIVEKTLADRDYSVETRKKMGAPW